MCLAAQNVPRKMDEEGLPRDGFKMVSAMFGSWSAMFSHLQVSVFEGSLARTLRFTAWFSSFWGKSRTKASFSQVEVAGLQQWVFADLFSFLALFIFLLRFLLKRPPKLNCTFFGFGGKSQFWSRFWAGVWDQLRRCKESWEELGLEDVKRGEKRWEDMRWADMSCEELRRVVRRAKKIWEELR